ncbi:MAG: sodium/glutamate symporter [Woeseiaceae bacterium]|nr:sodium/glutamate symporter [Woeseiaceae bacterium]
MTTLDINLATTLLLAIAVLFIGGAVRSIVKPLRDYNVPVPVVGGLIFAISTSLLYAVFDIQLSFDMRMKTPLMLAFFISIGLSANLKLLIKGGKTLLIFLVVVTVFLIVQDAVGVATAMALDLHPLVGLLSSSITLSGGHGTGAAYAEKFGDIQNIQGGMELAMACATFGLIIGGIIGGPVAQRLIARHKLQATTTAREPEDTAVELREVLGQISSQTILEIVFIVTLCLIIGGALYGFFAGSAFTLPVFIWSLFIGVIIRNVSELTGVYKIHADTLDTVGRLSLSVFLALALMSLRLWELLDLAGPLLIMMSVQTAAIVLFASFVTYRVMGSNYDSAIMSAGHCGFAMGATPTAVANMEAVTARYGPSPQAFLVIPMVGAFFIDLTNALVIQAYLSLPLFGF